MPSDAEQLYSLDFDLDRSVRYHRRRQGYLRATAEAYKLAAVLAASAAAANAFLPVSTASWASAVSAALVPVILYLLLRSKRLRALASLHDHLGSQFVSARRAAVADATPDLLRKLTDLRLQIEMEEPPIYRALDMLCHNAVCRARGLGETETYRVGPMHRLLANLFRFPSFVPRPAKRPNKT